MGLGYTFLSGATSAWIVDEIGQGAGGSGFLTGDPSGAGGQFLGDIRQCGLAKHQPQLT